METEGSLTPYPLPETCCGVELSWKEGQRISYRFKRANCSSCSTFYEQNLGSTQLYVKKLGDDCFKHEGCGEDISSITVSHSVHMKEFGLAGTGEVLPEEFPFCPKHEERPSEYGSPVYYGPVVFRDGAIDANESQAIVDETGRVIRSGLA